MDFAIAARGRRGDAPDGGFTLIEMLTVLVLAGIAMSIGILAMRSFLISSRENGTAVDIRSALRNASEQSLSEGKTYCVYFTATTWSVYRSDCTVAANKVDGPHQVDDPSITLTSISFPAPATPVLGQTTSCPSAGRCAYFYPRGTSLGGSLQVTRQGKTYTINVEGLTSRVSMV